MHILLIPIFLANVIAIKAAASYQRLTPNHQQVVLCVKEIDQRHFSSTHSIIMSVKKAGLIDNENTRSMSTYWEQAMTTDALLDSIHSELRWSLHISQTSSNLQAFRAHVHR
jgi:predicted RND superfamily exporter protein